MKGTTHSTEEIIRVLRQADGGETALSVCREHNIPEQSRAGVRSDSDPDSLSVCFHLAAANASALLVLPADPTPR